MKQIYRTISLGLMTPALLGFFAPNSANASEIPYDLYDTSVTVYSLDGPPEPVQYDPPTERPVVDLSDLRSYSGYSYSAAANTSSATKDASEIAMQEPTGLWGARWSGRASLGASLQTGNTEQDAINADALLKAKWADIHRATLEAEFNRETEDDDRTEDNWSIDGMYDYFFRPKWFVNSTLGFEQDDIDQIDLRTTAGVGLGHQVFERDDLNLQYVLGPSYLREDYEDGGSDSSLAARWAFDYDQKFYDDLFQAFHKHEFLVPTDETNAFLFDSKTGIRVPLKKGFIATGEVDFEWDNDPEPGVKEDDTTYALKLGYEW